MLRKLQLSFFLASLVVLTVGCGTQKDIAGVSAAVTQFHAQLDHQDYLGIYTNADA